MSAVQEQIGYHGVLLSVITKDGKKCLARFFESCVPTARDGEVVGKSGRRRLLKDYVCQASLLDKKGKRPEWTNEELQFFSGSSLACLSLDELEFSTLYKLIVSFCETPEGTVDPMWWEKVKHLDTSPHCDVVRLQRAYVILYDAPNTRMTREQFDSHWKLVVEVFGRMLTGVDKERYKSIYERCILLKGMASYFQLLSAIESSLESLGRVFWSDDEKDDDDDDEGAVLQVLCEDVVDGIVHSSLKVDTQHMFYPQDAKNPALPRLGRLHRVGALGAGGFGKVRLYKDVKSGIMVAVKKDGSRYSNAKRKVLLNEISLMRRLCHERVVMYYGAIEVKKKVYLLMEYVPKGSVSDKIKKTGRFEEKVVKKLTYQMLEGLIYLHSKQIIHRDIKGSNVLLTEEGDVKLTDFGLSLQMSGGSDYAKGRAGTLFYMAPEVLRGMSYGTKADIWSLGCTVVEMLTTRPPWVKVAQDSSDLAYKIANNPPSYDLPHGAASALLRAFLYRIFVLKPHFRPSAAELIEDKFFKKEEKHHGRH